MLWIEPGIVICCATLGGLFGGIIMSFAHNQANRFNMRLMEHHWSGDYLRLKEKIEYLEKIISTKIVDNAVSKNQNFNNYKGHD